MRVFIKIMHLLVVVETRDPMIIQGTIILVWQPKFCDLPKNFCHLMLWSCSEFMQADLYTHWNQVFRKKHKYGKNITVINSDNLHIALNTCSANLTVGCLFSDKSKRNFLLRILLGFDNIFSKTLFISNLASWLVKLEILFTLSIWSWIIIQDLQDLQQWVPQN